MWLLALDHQSWQWSLAGGLCILAIQNGTPMGAPATGKFIIFAGHRSLKGGSAHDLNLCQVAWKLLGVPERAVLSKPPKPQCALVTAEDDTEYSM